LNNCYDGDGASTADLLNGFDEKVDRALNKDKPKLSQDAADMYKAYVEDLRFISALSAQRARTPTQHRVESAVC
jgi:beta-glucosidase/6-phospho-beta-glucosidase/beta-galactosidase